MKRIAKALMLLCTAAAVIACTNKETAEIPHPLGSLTLSPIVADMVPTKSQITVAENKLSNASVVVYDDEGDLAQSVYVTDMSAISFPYLHIGETYHVYAAFNVGELTFPKLETNLSSLAFEWDASTIGTVGFPMVWSGTVTLSSDGQVESMEAVRLVSKVKFSVSNASLTDHDGAFTVSSVELKNSTKTVSIFSAAQTLKGDTSLSSDSATSDDITSVNAGNKISFYTFENLGGTLLPSNTDPWNKVPTGIGDNADKCTYLEVSGTYSTDGGTCTAPVTYKMYIGENSTTNFDLVRNYIYDVTLVPSDEGIDRTSWKVTTGTFTDDRDLSFSPVSVTMDVNSSKTFTVVPSPSDMEYSVTGGTGWSTSTLTLIATGNPNEYSLTSSGTLTADASTTVVATSWDGRVTANLPVTVYAKVLSKITLTPATVTKFVGGTQDYTVKATYTTGGVESEEDVTSSSTLESSDATKVSVSGMTATAVSGGSATLTAKYSGKSATATFIVDAEDGKEYRNASVSISANPTTIGVTGGSSELTYSASYEYRVKYSSGSYSDWTSTTDTPVISGGADGFTRDGASVTVATNTGSERSVIYYADFTCPDGTTKATQKSVTITQAGDGEASREYRNAAVSISASPKEFTAVGGTSTLTYSASYEYRIKYASGTYSDWTSTSGTPTITGSATGFTRDGASVTVAKNTSTTSRSVTYYADFTCPDGTTKATQKSVTITQTGDSEASREYRNASVSISASTYTIAAAGGTSTLTYSASYQYRIKYASGNYGEWTDATGTPTITGSATGFTRSGTTVTAAANTGSERSVAYHADFTCPDGTTKATQKSVIIHQSAGSAVGDGDLLLWDDSAFFEYYGAKNSTSSATQYSYEADDMSQGFLYSILSNYLYCKKVGWNTNTRVGTNRPELEGLSYTMTMYVASTDNIYDGGIVLSECLTATSTGNIDGTDGYIANDIFVQPNWDIEDISLYVGLKVELGNGTVWWADIASASTNQEKNFLLRDQPYMVCLRSNNSPITKWTNRPSEPTITYETEDADAQLYMDASYNVYIWLGDEIIDNDGNVSFTDNFGNTFTVNRGGIPVWLGTLTATVTKSGSSFVNLKNASSSHSKSTTMSGGSAWIIDPYSGYSSDSWWYATKQDFYTPYQKVSANTYRRIHFILDK